MPPENLEDGIYIVKPAEEWLVVEEGIQQTFRAPDYDLPYLLRAYADRAETVPLRGVIKEDGALGPPSRGLKGFFTGAFAVPGYDANGNHIIGPAFTKTEMDGILSRVDKILAGINKPKDKS